MRVSENQNGGELSNPNLLEENNFLEDSEFSVQEFKQSQIKTPQEYNNSDCLLHINIGDYLEIKSLLGTDTGILIYKDSKQLEIKTENNKELYLIQNQR